MAHHRRPVHAAALVDVHLEPGRLRALVDPTQAAAWCAGHFPGDPLVPGAHLAGVMAAAAAHLVDAGCPLAEIVRCTFLARVRPGDGITVSARLTSPTDVAVEVHTGGRCAARATIRFGGRA